MKRIFIIIFFFITGVLICQSQWVVDTLAYVPGVGEHEVTFLSEAPIIDGLLDKGLESLPARQFGVISKFQKDNTVPITYRIAYGTEFFYLFIEVEAEHITFRDRAFQNGDGFLLLLCKPQINNEPTDEFYELACSEVEIPDRIWQRHIFWNYNVNKLFIPTSVDTKLESREGNGKISFELILPWADVRPYHPWISDGIGFNLSFVKAVEPEGTVWYQAVDDNSGREFSKRLYVPLRFRKPELKGDPQTFVATKEGHITEGQSLNATAVTISNKTVTENVNVFLGTGETLGMWELTSYECQPGITKKEFSLNSTQLIEGAYTICWNYQNKDSRGSTGLSVLQKFDEPELYNRLEKNSKHISKGSYNTIQFMIKELKGKIESLKTYETCVNERIALTNLMRMINLSDRSVDPFDDMRGFIRKAYQSKIDNSFQPYMVYLPENFDKSRKYPLMIFLHGSASDETNIQAVLSIIPKDFIAVGPFGRGKSNGFTMDHAQDDIAEVITAVEEDYSIDTTKILLTGFSMGGYGAYRTYYETPTRYKALAIFSGTPSVSIKNAPDFVDEKNLASFRDIPVFIFHGEKDMNCPASITKDVAEKLKKHGAQVELQIDPEKGHERPDDKTLDSYLKWVDRVLK